MNILGLSCFHHDSAACLVQDGKIIAAVEEERLSRLKHDSRFPESSLRYVLDAGRITGQDLDAVVFYEKPLLKLQRILQTARSSPSSTEADATEQIAPLLRDMAILPEKIRASCGYDKPLLYCDHHLSHAASVYYSSPFDDAAVLIIDDVGEWSTTSLYHGKNNNLRALRAMRYPHSLGLFYTTITAFLGFEVNEGEYKVMGLAAYGEPTFTDKIRSLIRFFDDGSFTLDPTYFNYTTHGASAFTSKLAELLGPPREDGQPIEQRHMDIAVSTQRVLEEAILNLATTAQKSTGSRNLCLSGSVGHNIVANAKLKCSGLFDELGIHFACGNSGGAIGAALYASAWKGVSPIRPMRPLPYLGPAFTDAEIHTALVAGGYPYERLEDEDLFEHVAALLADSFVIGWHQGRLEFGPRALGNRSILASACAPDMKNILNSRVKHREEFRPFAPVVLAEKAADFFEWEGESPAMLFAAQVRPEKRSIIPAITHVDGSARPQTITRSDNPRYYDLIAAFEKRTGVPVLINTSFNVRGEPIVCSPHDAINCFAGTDIDFLVIGNFLVSKT